MFKFLHRSRSSDNGETVYSVISSGYRYLQVRGERFSTERPVYHMFHDSFTLDGLYTLASRFPVISKLVDLFRWYFPSLFLPQEFVLKVYEPSLKKNEISAEVRWSNELTTYTNLAPVQGRIVPRCYGSTLWNGHHALLIQYINGRTLHEVTLPYQKAVKPDRSELKQLYKRIQRREKAIKMTTDAPFKNQRLAIEKLEIEQRLVKQLETNLDSKYIVHANALEPLILSLKSATTILTFYGVKGDFNDGNILCRQDSVIILDFDVAEVDSSGETATDNCNGLSNLLYEIGVRSTRHGISKTDWSCLPAPHPPQPSSSAK